MADYVIFVILCCGWQLAQVRVELNELRDELERCVDAQDFARAAVVKGSISELDATKNSLLSEAQLGASGGGGGLTQQEMRVEKVRL